MPHVRRGMLLMLVTVMLFCIMDTISKYLARYYPVNMIVWVRYLVHTVLVLSLLGPRIGVELVRTSRPLMQLLRGTMLVAAAFFIISALKHMPIAEATSISFLNPIVLTLLSVVFLKEKVEFGRWVAIFCAFAGVLIIIRPGSSVFQWASILPLINAICFAVYQVLTRKMAGLESPYAMIFYPGLAGLIIFSFTLPNSWVLPQSAFHLLLFVVAGSISGTSHLIMIKAYALAPASRLAPFSYTQLVWVTLAGYVVFDNLPDHWSFIGIAVLIASGVYCANHQRLSEKEARRILLETPPGD